MVPLTPPILDMLMPKDLLTFKTGMLLIPMSVVLLILPCLEQCEKYISVGTFTLSTNTL